MALEQLFTACRTGDIDTVVSIIASRHVYINSKDEAGVTPLHEAIYNNQVDIVTKLLDTAEVKLTVTSNHNGGTDRTTWCLLLQLCPNHQDLCQPFSLHQGYTQHEEQDRRDCSDGFCKRWTS